MNQIICPKCQAVLNPDNKLILSAKKKDGNWGIVLLSSRVGDYSVLNHESFHVDEGEPVKFYCPACHVDLSDNAPNEHLARMEFIDENNKRNVILISSIAGEKCTYKITDSEIESFGKDSGRYRFDYQNLIDLV